MTLKQKAWGLIVLVLLALSSVMLIGLEVLRTASDQDNRARIKQLMSSTYSGIVQLENMAASGQLSEAQAKAIATRILRENKYNPKEYVYVADDKLIFVATPLDPQLHGTSFHDFKDAKGNSVGKILENALQTSGGKMAEYWWTSERDGRVVDLLSVAQRTPRWGWVVGTGISFDEVNARFWNNARWEVLVCLVLAAIVGTLMLGLMRSILRALGGEPQDVLQLVQRVADGDLSQNSVSQNTDPGSIYGAMLRMQQSLHEVLAQLAGAVQALNARSNDIVNSASSSNQLVETQGEAARRIAHIAEQFSSETQISAEHAQQAQQQSDTATRISAQGQQVITDAVNRLGNTEAAIGETQQGIDELAQRVGSISAVIAVIRDVAEQTNLLALNAAIEAARAGEQGRGFAVVADEVRKLAERTSNATREIGDTINAVQTSSQSAKARMDEMVGQLKHAIVQAREGGAAVSAIRQETEATAQLVSEIGHTLSSQVQAAQGIRNDVDAVAESSAGTLDASRNTVSAAQAIEGVSGQLAQLVQRFRL